MPDHSSSYPRLMRFSSGLATALIVLVLCSCGPKKPVVKTPIPGPEYHALVAEGDKDFSKHHLWGWRRALTSYRKAYQLVPNESVKEKLLLTSALIGMREFDEGIRNTWVDEEITGWRRAGNPRDEFLVFLTRRYRQVDDYSVKMPVPSATIEQVLNYKSDPLDGHLYSQYLKTYHSELAKERGPEIAELFKDSPLFLYRGDVDEGGKIRADHPEFAEFSFFLGELAFSNQIFGKAREHLLRAVELIPDHTGAINGLGDINFFGLQDYQKALECYERSLSIDPKNVKAMFGKAAALHYLGKYNDSTLILDTLLGGNAGDWRGISAVQTDYYKGEGYYYTAYNCYLLNDLPQARKRVETARSYLPKSGGINYLSGLMYYRAGQIPAAEVDFKKLLDEGSTYCEAPYYLGTIDHDRGGEEAPGYFLSTAQCLTVNLKKMETGLKAIPGMDLTEPEKAALKQKTEAAIREFRKSSSELLDKMIRASSDGTGEEEQKVLKILEAVRTDFSPAQPASAPQVPAQRSQTESN